MNSCSGERESLEPLGAAISGIDLIALAREIASRLAPDALLDNVDVGSILGCSARNVTERYALTPGFPKAIRLTGPNGIKSNPKWTRSDVMAWIESHKNGAVKRGGRPRRTV